MIMLNDIKWLKIGGATCISNAESRRLRKTVRERKMVLWRTRTKGCCMVSHMFKPTERRLESYRQIDDDEV